MRPVYIDHTNPHREGKKTVTRDTIQAIVINPKDDTVLCLKWKNYDWQTFIVGGVEKGEDPVVAAQREIYEETGYKHLTFIKKLGDLVESHYFATHKDENRIAIVQGLLFELADEAKDPISADEAMKHDTVWVPKQKLSDFVRGAEVAELWRRAIM